MKQELPPPILDSARVQAYAFVGDISYRRRGVLYVEETLLEHVPRLAICIDLDTGNDALLFHCDLDWNVLGVSGAATVADAKLLAEENYPGVVARWVDIETSVETALEYYDAQPGNAKCSFCNKRPFEVEALVEGIHAVICRDCVEKYYYEFNVKT